ncbi:aminopeptidase P N-terminal domain-containing protein [Mangrovimonas sp. AS39]|uniref:aminopeptidase P N-terminal domain-containing protein n=1 Tax=Mangrovimonas futianensis TaxID=2895523 RepID=UPI001E3EAD61|nr:aminopeptidase P N-terminal domain-containing protein [Mangrovimonas futianensis]MCF1191847.1 aminopeptidase P N-terminal domain-containing protein [Mangrovimonas futianensis]MCF1195265.1 aminopeptidase P N-terminal domain-containing protein [Mangrovimonas futianensis]
MKTFILSIFSIFIFSEIVAQTDLPTDYLSKEFHRNRREALRASMPENSVAVFFANPVRNRANDVDYVYHQEPNFYYLTGYKEPHAVLVVFSTDQTDKEGNTYNELMYVQEKNPMAEMWTGHRLGIEGAKNQLGLENAYNGKEFLENNIDFSKFDKIMFENFNDDYRNSSRNKADLHDLVQSFKSQINFETFKPSSQMQERAYQMIKSTEIENSANVAQTLGKVLEYYPDLKEDQIISKYAASDNDELRRELKQQVIKIEAENQSNIDVRGLSTLMAQLRQIKTAEELTLLTKAVRISSMGQREVMKAMHPGMSELEVQGIHEYVYKKYGSEYEGYPSIVGAGNNGCVLHYIENSKMHVENELVLMDLGAEYHGYSADVTRTIPANGKFSKEQKAIYDIVYEAQEAGIEASVVGASFQSPNIATRQVVNEGLLKLGIISSIDEIHSYYPHGSSHYLGLDVHDPGTYGNFEANMVITVEPGIYIPDGSPCDEKWWGIAVRIEDDILITEKGPVNLSGEAPRSSAEIEALMKESSALDDFVLPKLD